MNEELFNEASKSNILSKQLVDHCLLYTSDAADDTASV